MDHQAIAQLLGNYGEFVGAIAVVATLGYLAMQIRTNTRQSRAATTQSIVDSFNSGLEAVMLNPQLADAFAKEAQGEELSMGERLQLECAVNRNFNSYTAVQRAYDNGQIDAAFFETYCQDVARASVQYGWAPTMRQILSNFPNEAKMQIFASLYKDQSE